MCRLACVTPIARVAGRSVTTVEGLDPTARDEIAERFVASGAKVAIWDHDLPYAERTAKEIGPAVSAFKVDVSDLAAVEKTRDETLKALAWAAPKRGRTRIDARAALLFLFAGLTAPFALGGLAAKLDGDAAVSPPDLERYAATVAELIAHGLAPAGAATAARSAVPRTMTGGR